MSSRRPFAGVLAAGHGTRFQAAGVQTPKALVEVAGRSLIQRTLASFSEAGFDRVAIVVNDVVAPRVREHLARDGTDTAELHVKTTASTLETFATLLDLAAAAGSERFVFTTVDAVSAPGELARFVREASVAREDLVLGLADVDQNDESPLRAELDDSGRVVLGRGPHATAGFYAGRTSRIAPLAKTSLEAGLPSLRAFLTQQSALSGVRGILLGRTFDVDTPRDVALAERALEGWARGPGGGVG